MMFPPVMSVFRTLACMFVTILGVLGVVDAYNGYTVPLFAWRAMIALEVVAMMVGLFAATLCLVNHPDKKTFHTAASNASTVPLAPGATHVHYMGSVARHGTDFVFFALQSITAVWLLMQIVFIYRYTKDMDGYQNALDAGIPTDTAIYYTVFFKLQFLFSLQIQMVVALGICLVGAAASRLSKHHAT